MASSNSATIKCFIPRPPVLATKGFPPYGRHLLENASKSQIRYGSVFVVGKISAESYPIGAWMRPYPVALRRTAITPRTKVAVPLAIALKRRRLELNWPLGVRLTRRVFPTLAGPLYVGLLISDYPHIDRARPALLVAVSLVFNRHADR
jgi:hypothetical protein